MTSMSYLVIQASISLLLLGGLGHCASASASATASSTPVPLAFDPSIYWDGDGGHWSSFAMRIGTPPQTVRLVPSISGDSINPIWSYACLQTFSSWDNCTNASGMTFATDNSTTYKEYGDYYLPLNTESSLNLGNFSSQLGFDNISLGYVGYSNISLSNASIFADLNDSFSIGTFGLWPETTYSDSEYNTPIPTFLTSLRDAGLIPSLTWGYLAGAVYRSTWPTSAYGSLTLGGYDKSRMNLTSGRLTLAGGEDANRKYLLGLNSIETSDGTVLLGDPISGVSLDSQVSSIWLPLSACHAFESAFGLVWNSTYNMYLMNDTQYTSLKKRNPTLIFTLSTGTSNTTDTLNITLPYAAFDLETVPPINGQTFKYFPLNRSTDDTQYTLGRVILQETYMVGDFENGAISLWQAVYPDASVSSDLVGICASNSTTCQSAEQSSSSGSETLSHGAIAGIVIGSVAGAGLILLLALLGYLRWRRKKNKEREEAAEREAAAEREKQGRATPGTVTSARESVGPTAAMMEKPELDANTAASSPNSPRGRNELDGYYAPPRGHKSELSGDTGYLSPSQATANGSGSGGPGARDSRSVGDLAEIGTEKTSRTLPSNITATGSEAQELSAGQDKRKHRSELPGSPGTVHELPGSSSWPAPTTPITKAEPQAELKAEPKLESES